MCEDCGASFAAIQLPLRTTIQDFSGFVNGMEFILDLEARWMLELSDDDAIRLTSASSVCDFIVKSSEASKRRVDPQLVWAGLCEIASNRLKILSVTRDLDLLAAYRRSLLEHR